MLDLVADERGGLDGYDVVMEAGADADLSRYEAAGITWVMRVVDDTRPAADVIAAVAAGPHGPPLG